MRNMLKYFWYKPRVYLQRTARACTFQGFFIILGILLYEMFTPNKIPDCSTSLTQYFLFIAKFHCFTKKSCMKCLVDFDLHLIVHADINCLFRILNHLRKAS